MNEDTTKKLVQCESKMSNNDCIPLDLVTKKNNENLVTTFLDRINNINDYVEVGTTRVLLFISVSFYTLFVRF